MNNASKGQILLQHADVQWSENKKSIEVNRGFTVWKHINN